MSITELILRLTIAFITLLILTRLIGRKEISQMTFFNFISAISIGTIGASLAIYSTLSVRNGLIALIVWSAFTILLGIIDVKSKAVRIAVEGTPRIVIKNGEIMIDELRRTRLDIDALKAMLRQKNIFSMTEVDYAVFETDGKLSVLKKESDQSVKRSDMNIQKEAANIFALPTGIISDGKIDTENMKKLNINKHWVEQQLQTVGINKISDVFYAEIQQNGTLYITEK